MHPDRRTRELREIGREHFGLQPQHGSACHGEPLAAQSRRALAGRHAEFRRLEPHEARLPAHAAVTATLAQAERLLPGSSCQDDARALESTLTAQVALCVAGVAVTRALADEGAAPDAVAGHSAGAFPASVAAGALTFGEALDAVRLRGELMREACPSGYGMSAVLGLRSCAVKRVVESIATGDDPAYVAVVDTDQQVVVSGSLRTLERLAAAAARAGARRVLRLDIAVPSHCPLLAGVAEAMVARLRDVPRRRLTVLYVSDSTGRLLHDADSVLNDLARGVATTVRWRDVTGLLGELGAAVFVQAPPGHVLAWMAVRRIRELASSRWRTPASRTRPRTFVRAGHPACPADPDVRWLGSREGHSRGKLRLLMCPDTIPLLRGLSHVTNPRGRHPVDLPPARPPDAPDTGRPGNTHHRIRSRH
ncbi:acyltransferase domain-containing protein [Nonomuraea sp. NPDC046802]|uniref:acyltransferase domain-containing protein n=1 Tax=Nonomuraea sp. NPDC046802 TaxID=3154919 RepID=UPI0033E92ED3